MVLSKTATEKTNSWNMAFRLIISTGKMSVSNWEFLIFCVNRIRFKKYHFPFQEILATFFGYTRTGYWF